MNSVILWLCLFCIFYDNPAGLAQSNRYKRNQQLKDSPENSKRPKNAVLHHDTVTFQDIWVDPGEWNFLVAPEYPGLQAMIVPPFKINGKPYYRTLLKRHTLPSWIVPDSSLICVTWWHTDTSNFWQATDEIAVINGDPNHFREKFHRPADALNRDDTGVFGGFIPESEKDPSELIVNGVPNSPLFYVAPPFLIDGKPSYRLVARPSGSFANSVLYSIEAVRDKTIPCPYCLPSLVPDSTIIEVTSWALSGFPNICTTDAIRILGHK